MVTNTEARGDGYARLSPGGTSVLLAPREGGHLFVDLGFRHQPWDSLIASLRSMPPSLIGESSRLLFRSPRVRWGRSLDQGEAGLPVLRRVGVGWPESVDEIAESLQLAVRGHRLPDRQIGVVEFPLANDVVASALVEPRDLAIARSSELEALLRRADAIWRPQTYHYELPSGHHASSFVRVADALSDPAAPAALASWLHGCVDEATVLVLDSGTLSPLAQQVDSLLRSASDHLPFATDGLLDLLALDAYPRSRFEFLRRFKTFEGGVNVLALLSVSSTGHSFTLLAEALRDTVGGAWRAECLVTRSGPSAQEIPPVSEREKQVPWFSADGLEAPVDPSKACPYCRNGERAQVVHIDPRTFSAMALPSPTTVMPNIWAARRNASLFEAYEDLARHTQVTLLSASERTRLRAQPYHRGEEVSRVRFEPVAHLLLDDFASRMTQRADELRRLPDGDPSGQRIVRALDRVAEVSPTAVVCDTEEARVLAELLRRRKSLSPADADLAARRRLLEAAQAVCPSVATLVESGGDEFDSLPSNHTSVLLLAIGVQTGVTLQHMVVAVQDVFRAADVSPVVSGLVVHSHPATSAAWNSVRNTFGGASNPSLLALWLTYVPVRSPFAEEREILEIVQDAWFDGARAGVRSLWETRLAWLQEQNPKAQTPPSPFWSSSEMRLRRTSYYGALGDRQTLVAVGAALFEQIDRTVSRGAPEWTRVDVPNAFRSYFDGILHASILRWTGAQRAWWGPAGTCRALISELKGRFEDSGDWQMLLPELLLAAAQGKVPSEGTELLLAEASTALNDRSGRWADAELDFVDLGRLLVTNLSPTS